MNMRFKRNFPNKLAVDLRTNLFGNYLASPFSIDVDADILLVYKATNHLSITLRTQGIFDRDIAVRDSNGDGKVDAPGIQLKQLSGVGLTYNFGASNEYKHSSVFIAGVSPHGHVRSHDGTF